MTGITRSTTIEELVTELPSAVRVLLNHRVACLVCGEPVWGTLEEVARSAGLSEEAIDSLVGTLNHTAGEKQA